MRHCESKPWSRCSLGSSPSLPISWICMLSIFFIAATPLTQAYALSIVSVSIPVGSMDGSCHPLDDDVWSVSAPPLPLDVNIGIGFLINPAFSLGENLTLHDHGYVAPQIPDPTRAVVTYQFNGPVVVDKIEVIQHTNGITQIEGFVGNALESLTSIGAVFGPSGDITGSFVFTEGQSYVFDFNNAQAGQFFQLVIRKTSLSDGYAAYRAYPLDSDGNRIRPADAVGGAVTGVSLKRVVCRNVTTDQELVIELTGATSWDCTAAGLVVNPGDRIRQNLVGTAD